MSAADLIPQDLVDKVSVQGTLLKLDGPTWLRRLPALIDDVFADWGLVPAGPPRNGCTALVVPVERDGQPFMCKFLFAHPEAVHEHLALRHWNGHGACRLIAADPARDVLLLEALDPDRDLGPVPIDEACAITGEVLRRLHVPAPPPIRRLSEVGAAVFADIDAAPGQLPRRVVQRARGLFEELTSDPSCDATLLHTDLHFYNILAGTREPWQAIDPKPMAGHPGFELQPMLRNRADELGTGSAFRWSVRRRVEIVSEAAGIDEDQARWWSIVHSTFQAFWAGEDDGELSRGLFLSLVKALDD